MPAAPKHRDAIIEAAATLFRRNGYAATGLNDIVALSGAPKGSLYHYFPNGKTSIAEAAVRRASERASATLEKLAREAPNAGELVKAYASQLGAWMAKSGFSDGSPITTVLLEMAPHDVAVTEAGRAGVAARRSLLAAKLASDGAPEPEARSLARLAIAAIEGALVQARVEVSAEPLEAVAAELAALFAAATARGVKAKPAPRRVARTRRA